MIHPTEYPLLVFVLSFIALWLSAWVGWWFRRRQGTLDDELREDFGFILAATLTLLGLIIYRSKDGGEQKVFDGLEWLAAVCSHVPDKGEQIVRYYGYYSNVS